jgi:hypothetical protein
MLVSTAAILHDPADNEPPVSDEKKAVFYAAAELNVRSILAVIIKSTDILNTRENQSHSSFTPY